MTKGKLALFHVSEIAWDTDGEDPAALDLPSEVVVQGDTDEFADILSDHFGWCITGLCAVEAPDSDLQRLAELQFFGAGGESSLADTD